MTAAPLRLRPHHLLCALGYRGLGYSDGFTANMTALVKQGLHAPGGGALPIEVVGEADAICAPCPKRRGTGCTAQHRIAALDRAHAEALDIAAGDRLTWDEARARIRARVVPDDLDRICAGCEWLPLGLCKAALRDLHGAAE